MFLSGQVSPGEDHEDSRIVQISDVDEIIGLKLGASDFTCFVNNRVEIKRRGYPRDFGSPSRRGAPCDLLRWFAFKGDISIYIYIYIYVYM